MCQILYIGCHSVLVMPHLFFFYIPLPHPRFLLPEYILDFGYVIHGKVLSHTVKVTNTGPVAVSFHANCKPLAGTGNKCKGSNPLIQQFLSICYSHVTHSAKTWVMMCFAIEIRIGPRGHYSNYLNKNYLPFLSCSHGNVYMYAYHHGKHGSHENIQVPPIRFTRI